MKLSELKAEESAVITQIEIAKVDRIRLFHMGIYIGAKIKMLQRAPLHDPILFFVCGNEIFMRRGDASRIEVKLCKSFM